MEQFSKQSGCLCGPFYEEVLMSSYAVPHYSRRWVLLRGQYCSITHYLSSLVFIERLCWASLLSGCRDVFSWLDDSWRWYFYNCSDWWAISGLIAWYNCSLLPKSLSVSMTAGYVCTAVILCLCSEFVAGTWDGGSTELLKIASKNDD